MRLKKKNITAIVVLVLSVIISYEVFNEMMLFQFPKATVGKIISIRKSKSNGLVISYKYSVESNTYDYKQHIFPNEIDTSLLYIVIYQNNNPSNSKLVPSYYAEDGSLGETFKAKEIWLDRIRWWKF